MKININYNQMLHLIRQYKGVQLKINGIEYKIISRIGNIGQRTMRVYDFMLNDAITEQCQVVRAETVLGTFASVKDGSRLLDVVVTFNHELSYIAETLKNAEKFNALDVELQAKFVECR